MIKVSELFRSFQFEARYIGIPSIFLRTFGCNMRCKNFGRYGSDRLGVSELNPEVKEIIDNIHLYKTMEELPLVSTGCDSYPASYPQFRDFSPEYTTQDLIKQMINLLPHNKWGQHHLVITGGEPLLWQNQFYDLLLDSDMHELDEITFETNGTRRIDSDFRRTLDIWKYGGYNSYREHNSVTFSVSPKLSCSGESREKAIQPDIVCEYQDHGHTYLKFVVGTQEDVEEALEVIELYKAAGFDGNIWLMPVGGVDHVYALNERVVADLALKHGLCFSPRLQISIYGNKWAT